MIGIFDFQDLISTEFFGGDLQLGGLVMYAFVLMLLFGLTRKTQQTLILSIPVTLVFSTLGVLNTDLAVLLIIVTVLGLAFTVRNVWK